jgi:uncharacterized protein (TIGR03066 family)
MKHSKHTVKLRKPKPTHQQARKPDKAESAKSWLPRWAVIALCLVLAGGCTLAFCEYFVFSKIPTELVGKWVVIEGPDQGGTVDFYRTGTMVAKVNQGGREGIIDATIRVEENKIYVTTRHQQTGQEGTRVLTIDTINERQLVVVDEHGKFVKMERAQ